MRLSVVSSLYRSGPHLGEFIRRIKAVLAGMGLSYEIVLVNDGSPDNALDVAVELQSKDSSIRVVDLSRNFGHHKAMMTGLAYARGERVFLIDCDLEEEPELLPVFWERLTQAAGLDVVYGVQEARKGGWIERVSGDLFYTVFNLLSSTPIPRNLTTCRLMTRRYVDALLKFTEREMLMAGLWQITGFHQAPQTIEKKSRGQTSYSWRRKLGILVNSITSFSDKPLILIFNMGLVISAVSLFFVLRIVYRKTVYGIPVEGWSSLIASVWFIGGLSIFCLGVIGIYLSKIYVETKRRPYTIVRQIFESTAGPAVEPRISE